ncbi:MAG: D-galactarate dehydratase/altronate hydrolase-like [Marmoricola sp.]|nr:D-galactarate dehydratase/altronate hydrolase-like [Marmoricola sp.]
MLHSTGQAGIHDGLRSGALLQLHESDNVVVVLRDEQGGGAGIPLGHKIATVDMEKDTPVRKYGQVIGVLTSPVKVGEHVHSHNLRFGRDANVLAEPFKGLPPAALLPEEDRATFEGYVRSDGSVGTRNFLGVLTSVNCSATVARQIGDVYRHSDILEAFPHVDGLVPLTHGTGCGIGDPYTLEVLRRTLAGYLMHPNFAGFLVLGLGCEHNQITALTQGLELRADLPMVTMTIQEMGGTRKTVEGGVAALREMLPDADRARRQTVSASTLILGTNCGGSDGLSGLTANPALGVAVETLVSHGGAGVLAETPEVYGAEHLLYERAVSSVVADKLSSKLEWWERHVASSGGQMDNNPTPGNKAGGLTTIVEKSLGAIAKGGTGPLADVVDYAEAITSKGLVFMDTPGYDPVSVTGIVAGGAQVMCFTTGRGSAFGCKPVPSIKIATNSTLYRQMTDDMDVNAGDIADGTRTLEEVGQQIFELVLATASGQETRSEDLGYGDEEFVPWRVGAVI